MLYLYLYIVLCQGPGPNYPRVIPQIDLGHLGQEFAKPTAILQLRPLAYQDQ